MMAMMELKRALVTVQEMSLGNSPDIKAKSGEVVAGIESLLAELGAGPLIAKGMPAGIVSLEEAPVAAPAVTEEPAAEEPAPAEEEPAAEESEAPAEPAPAEEESAEEAPAEEESSEGGDEGGDDEEEEDE